MGLGAPCKEVTAQAECQRVECDAQYMLRNKELPTDDARILLVSYYGHFTKTLQTQLKHTKSEWESQYFL